MIHLNAHRYSQIDVIALLVVASLSLQSPAFLLEDALFFNSVNNVENLTLSTFIMIMYVSSQKGLLIF